MKTGPLASSRHGAIGLDWGTSRLRAYRVDGHGALRAKITNEQGILQSRPKFAEVCERVIAELGGPAFAGPVILSGMIGSSIGWQEVPYLALTEPLTAIATHLSLVLDAPRENCCWIVPGYAGFPTATEPAQGIDVMRGEEIQLLGANLLENKKTSHWYVLPGTHSKWAHVQDGLIRRFTTFMTGELFAVLTQHGTLAPLMQKDASAINDAFQDGVAASARGGVSSALFGCRARVVTGRMPTEHARGYLSGLLIGAEWREALTSCKGLSTGVTVIGAPALAELYRQVGAQLHTEVTCLDPDEVYVAGLAEIARRF